MPASLWASMRSHAQARADVESPASPQPPDVARWRIVLALMLMMGDSGLRREEAANARREALRLSPHGTAEEPVWQLTIVGKRHKQRTVPVSVDTVDALRAHWRDRGEDFDRSERGPLLSPLVIPQTPLAQRKHASPERQPYNVDVLNDLIEWVRKRFAAELDHCETSLHAILANLSPHAFRHTFGTQAVAEDVPLDVVQKVLGHTSLQTTSIYVQAEEQRMLAAAAQYYGSRKRRG